MSALIGVPCRLRMLCIFSNFDNMLKLTISSQAKRAETDPRQGTPTRAHHNRLKQGFHRRAVFFKHTFCFFVLSAHALPHFAISFDILQHFIIFCYILAHILTWKSIRGNCGTSATTPFVPTPSGSFQLSLREDFWGMGAPWNIILIAGKYYSHSWEISFS